MEDRFAALAAWHDFFAAVAGVAATLVGLLFVALALNPAVMADDGPAGLRTWAGQTFHNFLMVLFVALVVLIPETGPLELGLPLLILGVWGVARVIADARRVRSDPAPEWHGRALLTRFASPLAGYAIAVWVGAQILRGEVDAVGWLVATVFFLMMSAAGNCWDLLREIGDRHRTGGLTDELRGGLRCCAAAANLIGDSGRTTCRRHGTSVATPYWCHPEGTRDLVVASHESRVAGRRSFLRLSAIGY